METRTWMDRTTEILLEQVDGLSDAAWDGPSLLPDWRPREVVAHVHHNAEALLNLASWARTGVEKRMYPSMEQRDADIAVTAQLPASELRALVHGSAERLAAALDELTDEQWGSTVITAQGREVAATEIPWMRAREAGIHAIDLGGGAGFEDLPQGFVHQLVEDVVRLRLSRGEGPTLAAWLTGRETDGIGPWI